MGLIYILTITALKCVGSASLLTKNQGPPRVCALCGIFAGLTPSVRCVPLKTHSRQPILVYSPRLESLSLDITNIIDYNSTRGQTISQPIALSPCVRVQPIRTFQHQVRYAPDNLSLCPCPGRALAPFSDLLAWLFFIAAVRYSTDSTKS